ncbi:hypothetical protein [Paraburkholderia sp.]|uniref:hypothetical protein n=1 Tax=Paraburkholderia sp. TaxID=1926495 RepID=UPI0025F1C4AD|nr:hypothetical protein [Paraburkholderia sp.]
MASFVKHGLRGFLSDGFRQLRGVRRGARPYVYSSGRRFRLQPTAKKYCVEKAHRAVTAGWAASYLQADRSRIVKEGDNDLNTVLFKSIEAIS